MNKTRSKRWNGDVYALPVEYLKEVMAKMSDYGDRVQFSLVGAGSHPSYQVMNALGKKMAFDSNHHLLRPEADEFAGSNASAIFTLDQIKARVSGAAIGSASAGSRVARVVRAGSGGSRAAAARLDDQFAAQRYEYFKNNRDTLPPAISRYSDEIAELMKKGKPVEEAFNEVVKKYF